MFSLSELRKTKVYQEALEEGRQEGRQEALEQGRLRGKLESISRMQQLGITQENIAQVLELNLNLVKLACLKAAVKVSGFLQLLEDPKSQFSVEQLNNLQQLLTPLEDDLEKLSLFIFVWLEKHPDLRATYHKILKIISASPEEMVKEPLNKASLLETIQRRLSTE